MITMQGSRAAIDWENRMSFANAHACEARKHLFNALEEGERNVFWTLEQARLHQTYSGVLYKMARDGLY